MTRLTYCMCVVFTLHCNSWSNRTRTDQQSKKEEEMYKKRRKDVEGKIEQTKREIEIASKETIRMNEIKKKLKRGLSFCSIVEIDSLLYLRNEAC